MKKFTGLLALSLGLALMAGCGNDSAVDADDNDTILIDGDEDFVDESDYLMDVNGNEETDGELAPGIGSLLPTEDIPVEE